MQYNMCVYVIMYIVGIPPYGARPRPPQSCGKWQWAPSHRRTCVASCKQLASISIVHQYWFVKLGRGCTSACLNLASRPVWQANRESGSQSHWSGTPQS